MKTRLPDVTTRIQCLACGSTTAFRLLITQQPSAPGSARFNVRPARDDLAWLRLFDQAHHGPIERVR
jgi:hypothetical protein